MFLHVDRHVRVRVCAPPLIQRVHVRALQPVRELNDEVHQQVLPLEGVEALVLLAHGLTQTWGELSQQGYKRSIEHVGLAGLQGSLASGITEY